MVGWALVDGFSERFEPPRLRAWSKDVLAGAEIPFESCPGSRLERVEAREGRLERLIAVADARAPRVEQADPERTAAQAPGHDEATALELPNEVTRRLSGDEQLAAERTGMGLLGLVEQLHDLELRERDAHLNERVGEPRAQDPVDPSFGVDEPTCAGRLLLHRDVLA